MAGISKLSPTVVLLLFAVLYFCTMIDAGLFDPLVRRVVRIVGGDPLRVALGTTVVVLLLSLDGDGASTALVTIGTFLPIYRRLGMNPLILAVLLGAGNGIVNLTPWGGPTGRVAAALQLDPAVVFLPLLPTMLIGMLATLGVAWYLGPGGSASGWAWPWPARRVILRWALSATKASPAQAGLAEPATDRRRAGRGLFEGAAAAAGLHGGLCAGAAAELPPRGAAAPAAGGARGQCAAHRHADPGRRRLHRHPHRHRHDRRHGQGGGQRYSPHLRPLAGLDHRPS